MTSSQSPKVNSDKCAAHSQCSQSGNDYKYVGHSTLRPDAVGKLTGRAKFLNDMSFNGMLFAYVVRSPHAKALIRSIDTSQALAMPGVHAVLTCKDVPGENIIPLVFKDLPMLAEKEVLFIGQPVALIAAETKEQAIAAGAKVIVDYQVQKPSLTIEEGFERKDILCSYQQFKGDPEKEFADPDNIIHEAVYRTSHQEHAYLETNCALAVPESKGGIVVYGSMQCPFYVQKGVANVLGVDYQRVRVIQTATGGGFGGKEDGPSTPGCLAATLCWATDRPVKLVYERDEDMDSMTKRHPAKIVFKSAVSKDGIIKAVDIHNYLDGGAYITLSSIVLWRGLLHAAGPYNVPNVKILADAVRTNTAPNGAFRGFGQPQVIFACESHWDQVAADLGMDPVEFRRKNMLRVGDRTTSNQLLTESVGSDEVLDKVIKEIDFYERKKHAHNTDRYKKGVGVAISHYGVGLGANGGPLNNAGANLVIAVDGSVSLAVGTTEIGQGMTTVLSQIAAEVLRCPMERIFMAIPDTAQVPESGPTVASRTTLMSGNAVYDAAKQLRDRLDKADNGDNLPWNELITRCWVTGVQLSAQGWATPGIKMSFDKETGQGDTYAIYTWCANAAAVTVDTYTGEITVDKFVSGQDIGKTINPSLCEGQVQGGALQGIGYTLVEEYKMQNGKILNNNLSSYILPTAMDVPEIVPVLVEHNYSFGPYGAKGFGETPVVPVAPAIINAVYDALGIRLTQIPATPERVWEAINNKGQK